MASFTLDEVKRTVESKYAPLEIDLGEAGKAVLRPVLRLSSQERAELSVMQGSLGDLEKKLNSATDTDEAIRVENDFVQKLRDIITLVSREGSAVDALLQTVGDDLAILMEIFESYQGSSQPGEASPSPS